MSEKIKKRSFWGFLINLFLLPTITVLVVIGFNSNYLITRLMHYLLFVFDSLVLVSFIVCLVVFIRRRKVVTKKMKLWLKIIVSFLATIYISGCVAFLVLLYGPNDRFRTWLITTAMQTMNHQYFCKWFYNDKQIAKVLDQNKVIESGESTDTTMVTKKRATTFIDEYDKEILDVDIDLPYKVIELDVNGCKGYLAAIYDPSKVKLAVTSRLGTSGQYVTKMAADHDALLGINAGGFYDPNYSSSGGMPTSITISGGKIVTNNTYSSYNQGGGIIGFTNDDVFVLLKNTTASQAIAKGVRDAVSWGPFLIVNGNLPSSVVMAAGA